MATEHNHLSVVKLLIEEKANVNICNNNDLSPLYFAMSVNNDEMIYCYKCKKACIWVV